MKKLFLFIFIISLCAAPLTACKEKTIPADPLDKTPITLPQTEAPKTEAPAVTEEVTAAPAVTEEIPVYATADEFVLSLVTFFETMKSNMLSVLNGSDGTSLYPDPAEFALTKASYEVLAWSFGDLSYISGTKASLALDITMLDEKAVFDKYIVLVSEKGEDDGSLMQAALSGDIPTVEKNISLNLIKEGGTWKMSDDNAEFNELFTIGQIG